MAEFERTMHDWHRMCKTYATEYTDCTGCPLLEFSFDKRGCDAIYSDFADNANWTDLEKIVAEWADEHPAPVYPTWFEYLKGIGVISEDGREFRLKNQITPDIAEKLGIEPKGVEDAKHKTDQVG